jgi:hypothetical protein
MVGSHSHSHHDHEIQDSIISTSEILLENEDDTEPNPNLRPDLNPSPNTDSSLNRSPNPKRNTDANETVTLTVPIEPCKESNRINFFDVTMVRKSLYSCLLYLINVFI